MQRNLYIVRLSSFRKSFYVFAQDWNEAALKVTDALAEQKPVLIEADGSLSNSEVETISEISFVTNENEILK